MALYQRGETHVGRITIRNQAGVVTTPTTIKETIYDPCGYVILNSGSMASESTGKYFYNYTLSSTATYGRYTSKVTATVSGYVAIFKDEFYVLPWDGVQDVRQTMGVPEAKSIDDDTITNSLWNSYQFALKDLMIHHKDEIPDCNPNTGASFDGSNTQFKTHYWPIADINGDGTVKNTCPTDIVFKWADSTGQWYYGDVVIDHACFGDIHLYQSDGVSAIPQNNEGVALEYWSEPEKFDSYLFQQAVVRLCCYELSKRFSSLNEITLASIRTNNPLIVIDPNMWFKEYKRYLRVSQNLIISGI